MRFIIITILIAAIALIGSQFTFIRRKLPLGTRHILLTGTEFIFVGLILGPTILDVLDTKTIRDLHPILSFGLGWIGFLFGLQFDFKKVKYLPSNYFSITIMQAVITFVIVMISFYVLLLKILNFSNNIALISALTLGAVAACTGQSSMAMIHHDYHIPSKGLMNLFRYIAGVDALVGISIFALALCYYKGSIPNVSHLISWKWFALSIFLGLTMGSVFHLLTFHKLNQDELLLNIIGVVTFSAGIALYFKLSPLMINFIMGLVVTNLSIKNIRILEIMIRAEKSIYILMVILAGASWQFSSFWTLVIALIYVLVRIIGKFIGGVTAAKLFPTGFTVPNRMGLGLLSQGGIAVAIIINFQQVYQQASVHLILNVVILAVIINDLISPAFVLQIVKDK